jgi:hypothetical protein
VSTASYAVVTENVTSAATASHLIYSVTNGTASAAMTASAARFLQYFGTNNGTASYAVKANISNTATNANFLNYDGSTSNGTASYSVRSFTASYAISTTPPTNTFLVYGPYTPVITNNNTASFRIGVTSSAASVQTPTIQVVMEGDIRFDFTGSTTSYFDMFATSASLLPQHMISSSNLSSNIPPSVNSSRFSFKVGSSEVLSGSLTRDFSVRGVANFDTMNTYAIYLYAYGSTFATDVRGLTYWVYSRFDNININ